VAAASRLTPVRRLASAIVRELVTLGLGPAGTYLLTVPGRRSGQARATPVTLVESEDSAGSWRLTARWAGSATRRAAGRVTLSRGRRTETVALTELDARDAAPIVQRYAREVPITRPFLEAGPGSPVETFAAEAARHPVLRISPGSDERDAMRVSPGRSA
jgi:hypothetical protein